MADNFDVYKWNKNRFLKEESSIPTQFEKQVAPTAAGFNKVIDSIDDSMHYGVFAKAVAKVLKDEYGSHNIKPFMDILHSELGLNEGVVEENFSTMDKEEIASHFAKLHPELRFYPSTHTDRIDVIGGEQDKWNFADKMDRQVVGDYEVSAIEDDDRGLVVRFNRINK